MISLLSTNNTTQANIQQLLKIIRPTGDNQSTTESQEELGGSIGTGAALTNL